MRKFSDTVLGATGGPGVGTKVYVYATGTTTQASLFQDNETTAINQPVIADSRGHFEFNVAAGIYDVKMVKGDDTVTVAKVQIDGGGGVGDGSITTAKFDAAAKAPFAGTADLATNATHATTADLATNATHASTADSAMLATQGASVRYEPMRLARVSKSFTINANCMCEYFVSGVRKMAVLNNFGVKLVVDIATGTATAQSTVTNLASKTFYYAFYNATIDRIIAMMTDGGVYVIDQTAGPAGTWVATLLFSGTTNGAMIPILGHDQFVAAATSTGGLLKYDCSVNPPTLITAYTPETTDTIQQLGYDPVGDFVYFSNGNAGVGTGAKIWKVPRVAFNSQTNASTSSGGAGPNSPGTPPNFLQVIGSDLFMTARSASSVPELFYTIPGFNRNFWGAGISGQCIPYNGKLYGYSAQNNLMFRLDLNSGDPIYELMKPIEVVWGTGGQYKDFLLGTDNYFYALVTDSVGYSVYQYIP